MSHGILHALVSSRTLSLMLPEITADSAWCQVEDSLLSEQKYNYGGHGQSMEALRGLMLLKCMGTHINGSSQFT